LAGQALAEGEGDSHLLGAGAGAGGEVGEGPGDAEESKLADVEPTEDVVIYARQSENDEDGVIRQFEDTTNQADRRGWRVVGKFKDNDKSAADGRKKREGFEKVIQYVVTGRAKVVLVTELTRLQRNRMDELRLYDACKEAGAIISQVRGPDLDFTTAAGRFTADVLGAVARSEIETKGERHARAQQQAAHRGNRVGGRRPFGYDATGMKLIPEEAKAIKKGYNDLLAGVPLAAIARSWNKAGLTTGQGGQWDHNNVGMVLRNARNLGKRTYHGEIVADGKWPAIVSEPTFLAVKVILDDPSRRSTPKSGKALLTGVALCGVCKAHAKPDEKVSTVHTGGTATHLKHRTYRCSGALGHVARNAEPVDKYVSDCVVERLSRPDAASLLVDREAPDVEAISNELLALRSRQETIAVQFADGELTARQLKAANDRLKEQITKFEGQIADFGRVDILGPLIQADDVQAVWDELELERRRAVIATVAEVVVHPPGRGTRTFRPETVTVVFKDLRDD